jgi:phenylacetate-CoA ligase
MQRYWKGEIEAIPAADRAARNLRLLSDHLEKVYKTSPFYRQRLDAAGVNPGAVNSMEALAKIPPLEKPEIIADQAANAPYGSMLAVDPIDIVRQYIGPGPQTTYWTREDEANVVDDGAWAFSTNGFRPTDTVDITIMYHWVIAGTLMDDSCRRIGCATIPGGIGAAQQHLDAWRWSNVSAVFAFPTFLDELADKAQELGIEPARDLQLRLATVSGEQRSAAAKSRMEEFWGGIRVREFYGGSEVPFIASEPEEGGWMHTNPDLIVEVVDPDTFQPVAEGEPGVVVATDFRRSAYPMIRYFTGDIVEGMINEPGESGRTTSRIGRILGRHGSILRVKGLFVVPTQVRTALDTLDGLGTFRLIADRPGNQDTLTVQVEHADPTNPSLPDRVIRALKDGVRLTCQVELVAPGSLDGLAMVEDRRVL